LGKGPIPLQPFDQQRNQPIQSLRVPFESFLSHQEKAHSAFESTSTPEFNKSLGGPTVGKAFGRVGQSLGRYQASENDLLRFGALPFQDSPAYFPCRDHTHHDELIVHYSGGNSTHLVLGGKLWILMDVHDLYRDPRTRQGERRYRTDLVGASGTALANEEKEFGVFRELLEGSRYRLHLSGIGQPFESLKIKIWIVHGEYGRDQMSSLPPVSMNLTGAAP
jgi:hypothetical protein